MWCLIRYLIGNKDKERKGMKGMKAVTAVEVSKNAKTGLVSATYSSQDSCPVSCPLRGAGCYAEQGKAGITTRRVNQGAAKTPLAIAREEAAAIDTLTGALDLRVHVVGDCKTPAAARLVAAARASHRRKQGRRAWTYTHAWREVSRKAWLGESILASCENADQVRQANARGYAAAIVLEKFASEKAYTTEDGLRIIPCPNQSRGLTCLECGICMNAGALFQRGFTVGFEAHGAGKGKIIARIALAMA
jgi:hypothetical protein